MLELIFGLDVFAIGFVIVILAAIAAPFVWLWERIRYKK